MTPQLTREQRQAIDEHNGRPVYVVDADRCETFVLLNSSDFEKVRTMLATEADNGPWTDEKNRRRVELIDKKIAGNIAHNELVELAELQQQAEKHFDQVAPPPMQGVRQLHQQLLNRRDSQQ
jgi:hypothetical protein